MISRERYLNQLIAGRQNGFIKIITGIRRCGKSFLLFRLFYDFLREQGVDDSHIIKLALDDVRNERLLDPAVLVNFVESKISTAGVYYILLDEIQLVRNFTGALNTLLRFPNADIYVTGSNSKFLSNDVATEFRGRGYEIRLWPLSFSEFYSARGGDKAGAWREFYTFGGLPQILALTDDEAKINFLSGIRRNIYLSDIVERYKIKNEGDLGELAQFLASNIGSSCNPLKISNTFKTLKKSEISSPTITKFLDCFEDSFLAEKAQRYDLKGKKYIGTLSKYYFSDLGIRNAFLNFRQLEENHLMENAIFNELRERGFSVDVGNLPVNENSERKVLEIDFIANRGNARFYIQSAYSIHSDEKREQELRPFLKVKDFFQRIVVVRDEIKSYRDEKGILFISLLEFLTSSTWQNA